MGIRLVNKGTNKSALLVNGKEIFFSYDTPVAGWDDSGAFRTDEPYSAITSEHINQYLRETGGVRARTVSAADIEAMLD